MHLDKQTKNIADFTMNQFQTGMMILHHVQDNIYETTFFNDALANMLGYEKEEMEQLVAESGLNIVYQADRLTAYHAICDEREETTFDVTYRLLTKEQKALWVLAQYNVTEQEDGDTYIFVSLTNIQTYIEARNRVGMSESGWAEIVNSTPTGLLVFSIQDGKTSVLAVNDLMVDFSNAIGKELDGRKRNWNREELMLLFQQDLYLFCENKDKHLLAQMIEESKTQKIANCTFRMRGSVDVREIWIYCSCCSKQMEDGARTYYVSFQDVTREEIQKRELKSNHEILLNLSMYDPLTGVKSRNAYNEYIEECKNHRIFDVGMAFADINGLKNINDTMGHLQGDQLIASFAEILKEEFDREYIFRISGDEFVIIVPQIERDLFFEKIGHVSDIVHMRDDMASIGYIWKDNVSDIRRRANQAEQLMYLEKKRYYEESQTLVSKHRTKMLGTLLQDLEDGRYEMYLQPKSYIDNQCVVAAEALVRKRGPQGEIVAPYEFVPQLEEQKLISFIDFFMLEQTCEFLQYVQNHKELEFHVSVNMSRVTLAEKDFVEHVAEICSKYQFEPAYLEFEITESNETIDNMRMEEDVKYLKEMGFCVSLDDVGTEYSSFPMLTLEGLDTVKLDRSFILKMKHPKVNKLISYIIDMCHAMGLKVIAEGVETDQERLALMYKNCDMYQGYLLSKPIPAKEFYEKYIKE